MSNIVLVHGQSDDLIKVEGGVSAEITAPLRVEDDGVLLEFDTGDQLRVTYTVDGEWEIEQEGQLDSPYSDLVVLDVGVTELFNGYSQVAIYKPWNGAGSVEVVDSE